MENHQIVFRDVYMSYDSDSENDEIKYVLKNVNITIDKGEFITILGANGSGKSTFAKLTNALLQPSSGKIYVNGMDTSEPDNEMPIRKKTGLVFQNPDNQIVASIVEEDVAFGPENLGIPPIEIRKRVDDALKSVGMYDYRFHETHRLSGGQKQRIAIAGMIAMTPECLVLDESTAMLDPKGRTEVINTVRKLNKELGITIIMITHFMEEAVSADRAVVIDCGEIKYDGKPVELFKKYELLKQCSLDVPSITEICLKLKKYGINMSDEILNEDDFVAEIKKIVSNGV